MVVLAMKIVQRKLLDWWKPFWNEIVLCKWNDNDVRTMVIFTHYSKGYYIPSINF
jgi:hypothetical protein